MTEVDGIYGPKFVAESLKYFKDIGDDAAGLVVLGFEPSRAIAVATERVQKRRLAYATAKAKLTPEEGGNVVPIRK